MTAGYRNGRSWNISEINTVPFRSCCANGREKILNMLRPSVCVSAVCPIWARNSKTKKTWKNKKIGINVPPVRVSAVQFSVEKIKGSRSSDVKNLKKLPYWRTCLFTGGSSSPGGSDVLKFRRFSVRKHWKSTFSIASAVVWRLLSREPREYPHKTYCEKLKSLGYISATIMWAYLHSNFRAGLRKLTYFETECVMAVQGHPRSLILVPIESACALPINHQ